MDAAGQLNAASTANVLSGNTIQDSKIQVGNNYHITAAPAAKPGSAWTVPFPRDPDFLKPTYFDALDKLRESGSQRAALVGIGGIGKSQIAIEFCYHFQSINTSGSRIFWIHAESAATFRDGFRRAADQLTLPYEGDSAKVPWQVKRWLEANNDLPYLIILDNADEEATLFEINAVPGQDAVSDFVEGRASLVSYLPTSANGLILTNTRDLKVAERLCGNLASVVHVESMSKLMAIELMKKKLVEPESDAHISELVEELDCVPLALTQAAAFITQRVPSIGCERYLRQLRKGEDRQLKILLQHFPDPRRDMHSRQGTNSVLRPWLISFEHILQERNSTADVLSLMSLFDDSSIPDFLVKPQSKAIADIDPDLDSDGQDDAFSDDLALLKRFSLIKLMKDPNTACLTFKLHALVSLSTRSWMASRGRLMEMALSAASRLLSHLPENIQGEVPKYRQLLPHFVSLRRHALHVDDNMKTTERSRSTGQVKDVSRSAETWSALIMEMGYLALGGGFYIEAQQILDGLTSWYKCTFGPRSVQTCKYQNLLGMVLSKMGQHVEAGSLHEAALEISSELHGPENDLTLAIMNGVAGERGALGDIDGARLMFKEVIATTKRLFPERRDPTLSTVNNLACFESGAGNHREAERLHREVWEARTSFFGSDNLATLNVQMDLGMELINLGRYEAARSLLEPCLSSTRRLFGQQSQHFLRAMSCLATAFSNLGRMSEANELYREVLRLRQKHLGENHPETITALRNLGVCFLATGLLDEAESTLRTALRLSKESSSDGQDNYSFTIMHILGAVSTGRGKLTEAEAQYKVSLEGYTERNNAEHPGALQAKEGLARVYHAQGHLDLAQTMLEAIFDVRKRTLGPAHPDTLRSMSNIAVVMSDRGLLKQAIALKREVLKLRQDTLGDLHIDTLESKNALAVSLSALGDNAASLALHQDVLAGRLHLLGPKHPRVLTCRSDVAQGLARAGKLKEAVEILRDVLELYKDICGVDHDDTLGCMDDLAGSLRKLDMPEEAEHLQRDVCTMLRQKHSDNHSRTLVARHNLATTLHKAGRTDEALVIMEDVTPRWPKIASSTHHDYLSSCEFQGHMYHRTGRDQEALRLRRLVYEGRKKTLEPSHPRRLRGRTALAQTLTRLALWAEEASLRDEIVTHWRQADPQGWDLPIALNNMSIPISKLGDVDTAICLIKEALALAKQLDPDMEHPNTLGFKKNLIHEEKKGGKYSRAMDLQTPMERSPASMVRR